MSDYCDGPADIYEKDKRLARKDHICDACQENISPGHFYWNISVLYEGCWDRYKQCLRCERIHAHLVEMCDPFDVLWPDERLSCGRDYREEWEADPPEEIQALAFATPEEMQRYLDVLEPPKVKKR